MTDQLTSAPKSSVNDFATLAKAIPAITGAAQAEATPATLSFEDAVQNFLDKLQERQDAHTAKQSYKEPVTFEVMEGPKYLRVVKQGHQRMVYCFLDREGNIYKAAGWKAPAKHVRGNIYNPDPLTGTDIYGPNYLR